MPFGLRNAPATFQRLIDRFKSTIPNVQILAYLDDIIICLSSFKNHLQDLDLVFDRLQRFKLHVNAKCRFCCKNVKFLGHILTENGISVDPEKTIAINDKQEHKNVKELISFIQTCSWYRRFIEHYAEIAKPLTDLTKKSSIWKWEAAQRDSFKTLKEKLTTSPILKQAQDKIYH